MINLMPPTAKENIRYGRYNRMIVGYLKVLILVVVVLGGVFAGADYLIQQQISSIAADVSAKEAQITRDKAQVLPEAQDASERLSAISYIQGSQTHFSKLISDLVAVMPVGVSLSTMTLTGNSGAPMTLTVTAETYDDVLAFRNALVTSPRVAAADIVNINSNSGSKTQPWAGSIVIGFNPGQAQ